jgi:hypothetical protein
MGGAAAHNRRGNWEGCTFTTPLAQILMILLPQANKHVTIAIRPLNKTTRAHDAGI